MTRALNSRCWHLGRRGGAEASNRRLRQGCDGIWYARERVVKALQGRTAEKLPNLTVWHLVCQKQARSELTDISGLEISLALAETKEGDAAMAEAEIAIVRIAPETSFKNKAYEALKEAILKMDIYATPEPVMLDERALSERLGVSRTPIREAIAMLEQDGFVKTVPRRGIVVVRRTKAEIVDMIRAWAALESMAARLITTTARKKDISALRDFFSNFSKDRLPQDHVEEYSKANIAFHQALISLSESPVLIDMTNDILLHVRGYRQLTIGRQDRTATSLPEHMAIIEALESRDTELAEKRAREHTLGLAAYVEAHGQELL